MKTILNKKRKKKTSPILICSGRHCFGKDPWCSPYLLPSNKPFLLPLFGLVVSFGSISTQRWTSFSGDDLIQQAQYMPNEENRTNKHFQEVRRASRKQFSQWSLGFGILNFLGIPGLIQPHPLTAVPTSSWRATKQGVGIPEIPNFYQLPIQAPLLGFLPNPVPGTRGWGWSLCTHPTSSSCAGL